MITFSPEVVQLNNPATPDAKAPRTTFVLNLTAFNSAGNVLLPSLDNPLNVNLYGVPSGAVTPTETQVKSGHQLKFQYDGSYLPDSITLTAWIKDPSTGGAALGTTQFIRTHHTTCLKGIQSFDVLVNAGVPQPIQINAVVGADHPTTSDFANFTIDTGSLGVIVPKRELVAGHNVHGPGAQGEKTYDSSGFSFFGNYYLAPVSIELSDRTFIQTNPILVLAIDRSSCSKSGCKPPPVNLHYLGVGFDRNSTGSEDEFDSPADNAFLQLSDQQNGTDINQGYLLSANMVTLGISPDDSAGFQSVQLQPSSTTPGDWATEPGCYGFPMLKRSPQFCGTLLLDVGIDEMFIDLPFSQRPPGSYDNNNEVPSGVAMHIQAGAANDTAMSYNFTAVQQDTSPVGPAPAYVQWINVNHAFVNTGRRPLLNFDYLYSGRCGEVGFRAIGGTQ